MVRGGLKSTTPDREGVRHGCDRGCRVAVGTSVLRVGGYQTEGALPVSGALDTRRDGGLRSESRPATPYRLHFPLDNFRERVRAGPQTSSRACASSPAARQETRIRPRRRRRGHRRRHPERHPVAGERIGPLQPLARPPRLRGAARFRERLGTGATTARSWVLTAFELGNAAATSGSRTTATVRPLSRAAYGFALAFE